MEVPLTDDAIAEFVAALQTLRTELDASLEDIESEAVPVDLDTPIGRLSRMDAIQQQKMAQASVSALKRRRLLVEQALVAASHEQYGQCRKCDEPIALNRLRARPESPFCLDCQGANEVRRR